MRSASVEIPVQSIRLEVFMKVKDRGGTLSGSCIVFETAAMGFMGTVVLIWKNSHANYTTG